MPGNFYVNCYEKKVVCKLARLEEYLSVPFAPVDEEK